MITVTNLKQRLAWLQSKWVLLISAMGGLFIGSSHPVIFENTEFLLKIYIDIYKLIVLPLIICAILLNVQKIFLDKIISKIAWKAILVLISFSFFASLIGLLAGLIFQPGVIDSLENLVKRGDQINEAFSNQVNIISLYKASPAVPTNLINQIIDMFIPNNIFTSIAEGEVIKVCVFSLLFGFSLTKVPSRLIDGFNETLASISNASQELSTVLSYLAPVILFIIFARISSHVKLQVIITLGTFLMAFIASALILIIFSSYIMISRTQLSIIKIVGHLKPVFIISIASAQFTTAFIPQLISAMHKEMGFSKERVELFVPITAIFLRTAPILFFSLSAVFTAQVYNHILSISDIFIILTLSVIQGFVSFGLGGQLKLALLAFVCSPIELPTEAVVLLLLSIEPLCELIGNTMRVFVQCASVSLLCNKPIKF